MARTAPLPTAYMPGAQPGTVIDGNGQTVSVPAGWDLLPPGDAALTRRVKAQGQFWLMQEKRGRKIFSRGMYAPADTIRQIQQDLAQERSTETYARKRAADTRRREAAQTEYVEDFQAAVLAFLHFHPRYADLAHQMATLIAAHATPVGSGTVARTKRIPVEARAEAATIAWMRHQTTAYDNLKIARIKGERREVRRQLAKQSHELLRTYRAGADRPPTCPLQTAINPAE